MSEHGFEKLREIIKILRSENGCPWDREQTHNSLKPCILEEAAEVAASIRIYEKTNDDSNMKEELGDVLLQVMMHSRIAEEESRFSVDDVIDGICEKMIRRHPHVFGDLELSNSGQVLETWEEIKQKEKQNQPFAKSPLKEIPIELPSLTRACKVQKKADKLYDTSKSAKDSIEAVKEALNQLDSDDNNYYNEIGEILFNCANIARLYKVDPEQALTDKIEDLIDEKEG